MVFLFIEMHLNVLESLNTFRKVYCQLCEQIIIIW